MNNLERSELEIAARKLFEEECIPLGTRGYIYLLEAVMMTELEHSVKMDKLYEILAEKHGVTVPAISHCVRSTILKSNEIRKQQGMEAIKPRSFIIKCSSLLMNAN